MWGGGGTRQSSQPLRTLLPSVYQVMLLLEVTAMPFGGKELPLCFVLLGRTLT